MKMNGAIDGGKIRKRLPVLIVRHSALGTLDNRRAVSNETNTRGPQGVQVFFSMTYVWFGALHPSPVGQV